MKNKELIFANIRNAKEELEFLLTNIEQSHDFSELDFKVALECVYQNLNFAWNIRELGGNKIKKFSEEDFKNLYKYPYGEIP